MLFVKVSADELHLVVLQSYGAAVVCVALYLLENKILIVLLITHIHVNEGMRLFCLELLR